MLRSIIFKLTQNIDKEIEEDHEYSELDKLVSDTAVTLVKEGKAKWQYLAEGYYNIASIFMITDQNYSEKYAEGIEIIGNKVFRVLKHGEIYSAFSSAKEQLEYNKLFSNYGNLMFTLSSYKTNLFKYLSNRIIALNFLMLVTVHFYYFFRNTEVFKIKL